MTASAHRSLGVAMRHDPGLGAIVIMLRSLKMYGMAQAVADHGKTQQSISSAGNASETGNGLILGFFDGI